MNNHPILHSSIRNIVPGDSLPYIFLKFTFPFSISCHCSFSCPFPSLFKLLVQGVERTFLEWTDLEWTNNFGKNWYTNQTDNKTQEPTPLIPSLRIPDVQGRYSCFSPHCHWKVITEVQWSKKYAKILKKRYHINWKLRFCMHLVPLASHLNPLYGGIHNTPAAGMERKSSKWYGILFRTLQRFWLLNWQVFLLH